MASFLVQFLKNKKIILFIFLLFLGAGFIFPKIAQAQIVPLPEPNWQNICIQDCCKKADCTDDVIYANCTKKCASPVDEEGPDTAKDSEFGWDVFKGTMVGMARLILWISWKVADFFANLFAQALSWTMNKPITTDAPILEGKEYGFKMGWASVRDLANMIIVLGFVIVGIATTLRIRDYEAKKLLFPLIVVAILINFSGLFCGLIIDASSIATKTFALGTGSTGTGIVNSLFTGGRAVMTAPEAETRTMAFVINCILFSILYIATAIVFGYLAILLIVRYAILAMLYILSPIAFAFWVFPATKKLWTEWWNHFLKWAFVSVIGGFFLFVASNLVPQNPNADQLLLIIALIFMFVGFKMTAKSSGLASMASHAVMGVVTGGAGLAMGAVAGGAVRAGRTADRMTGGRLSAAKERMSDTRARFSETFGGKTGAAAQQRKERATAADKQVEAMASAPEGSGDRARYEQLVRRGRGALGGAAINRANKDGDLNRLLGNNQAEIGARTTYASQFGYDVGEMAKSNPDQARRDTKRVNQIIAERGLSQADAENVAVREAYAKYKPEGLNQMNNNELANAISTTTNESLRSKYLEQLSDNGGLGELSRLGMTNAQIAGHINTAEQTYGSKVRNTSEKSMPALRGFNDGAVNDIITARGWNNTNPAHIAAAQEIAAVEGYTRLTGPQRRDLAPPNINLDAMTGSVAGTLEAARQMSPAQRARYRDLVNPGNAAAGTARAAQLRALGLNREADNLEDHFRNPMMATL